MNKFAFIITFGIFTFSVSFANAENNCYEKGFDRIIIRATCEYLNSNDNKGLEWHIKEESEKRNYFQTESDMRENQEMSSPYYPAGRPDDFICTVYGGSSCP